MKYHSIIHRHIEAYIERLDGEKNNSHGKLRNSNAEQFHLKTKVFQLLGVRFFDKKNHILQQLFCKKYHVVKNPIFDQKQFKWKIFRQP